MSFQKRIGPVVLASVFAMVLSGCTVSGTPKVAAVPASPVPPAPAGTDAPPIVLPQTVAMLPPPQPIPPESLPPLDPLPARPPEAIETVGARPSRSRSVSPSAAPTRTGPPAIDTSVSEQPRPSTMEEPSRPRLQTLTSSEANPSSAEQVRKRIDRVQNLRRQLKGRKLAPDAKEARDRIDSFLRLATDALKHDEIRQADNLSNRALMIAQDLLRVQ